MTVATDLRAAAELIEVKGWAQGEFRNSTGGLCIWGALHEAVGLHPLTGAPTGEKSRRAWSAASECGKYTSTSIEFWNDDPDRHPHEVIDLLYDAADAWERQNDPRAGVISAYVETFKNNQ